jgi:hypothetical protein
MVAVSRAVTPGHTRASLQCMVNICRLQDKLAPPSTQLTSNSASLFIPRSTVQSILDSAAGQSTLKSALQSVLDLGDQLILKSTIQSILESTSQPVLNSTSLPVLNSTSQTVVNSTSQTVVNLTSQTIVNSTTLPVPESTDTRPIWPGRPELIYQRYLAEKEAWITVYPTVCPSNYHKARGLEY